MRRVITFISPNEQYGGRGGRYAARLFILFSSPCSADHERDWPPCKVVFSGWRPKYAECEKQQQSVIIIPLYKKMQEDKMELVYVLQEDPRN